MGLLDGATNGHVYRDRVGALDNRDDAAITPQIVAATRLAERSLRLSPGAFNQATGVRRFSGNGKPQLWLGDGTGQHYLQSVVTGGITVDTNGDGIADQTLDLTDNRLVALPFNATVYGEPYDALELRQPFGTTYVSSPYSGVLPYVWPRGRGNVAIDGTWGWPAVPAEIGELVIHLVQEERQGHLAGLSSESANLDMIIPHRSDLWRRWQMIKNQYGLKRPRAA